MKPWASKSILILILSLLALMTGCNFVTFTDPAPPSPSQMSDNDAEAIIKTIAMQAWGNDDWGPTGIAWNGREFVIGSRNQVQYQRRENYLDSIKIGEITPYSYIDQKEVKGNFSFGDRFPIPIAVDVNICGLAWEGKCCEFGALWVADSKYDRLLKMDINNNILNSFPFAGYYPNAVAFDGQSLWVADSYNRDDDGVGEALLYQLKTSNGEVEGVFKSPLASPTGLASECEVGSATCSYLWMSGFKTCKVGSQSCQDPRLIKIDMRTKQVVGELVIGNSLRRLGSITWVDGTIWATDLITNNIFRMNTSKMIRPTMDWKVTPAEAAKRIMINVDNGEVEIRVALRQVFTSVEKLAIKISGDQQQGLVLSEIQDVRIKVQYNPEIQKYYYILRGKLPPKTPLNKVRYNASAEIDLSTDKAGVVKLLFPYALMMPRNDDVTLQ